MIVTNTSATPLVNVAVRTIVWPALRELGFLEATSRSAWRNRGDTIDVINFQAAVGAAGFPVFLGARARGPLEAALGSFAVNVGTYYSLRRVLPWSLSAYSQPPKPERPEEWSCDERQRLRTSLTQTEGYPSDIWEVRAEDPEGARAVADALSAIKVQALPWFERNADLEQAFQRLRPTCWNLVEALDREPDMFFRLEDLFAALTIRLGRVEEAVELFRALAARDVSTARRAEHEKEEATRQRRLARSKKPVLVEAVPFWHDGARSRLAALEKLVDGPRAERE